MELACAIFGTLSCHIAAAPYDAMIRGAMPTRCTATSLLGGETLSVVVALLQPPPEQLLLLLVLVLRVGLGHSSVDLSGVGIKLDGLL